jgi:hypothetical protein
MNDHQRDRLAKEIKRFGLAVIIGLLCGVVSLIVRPATLPAATPESCGNSSGCFYYEPGCGVGVGCVHKTCLASSCPEVATCCDCWYCDLSQDPCEDCEPDPFLNEESW